MKNRDNSSELQELTEECVGLIEDGFGINLKWQEILGLRNYLRCFNKKSKKDRWINVKPDALHLFMIDYFGLDGFEVGCSIGVNDGKKITHMKYGLELFSQDYYIGDERFKEYCKGRANMWRDEREVI